jgi:hypothetical protein
MTAISFGAVTSGNAKVVTNATIGLPQVDVPNTNATVTLSATAPSDAPAPQAHRVQTRTHQTLAANVTPLLYMTMTMSNTVTLTQTPMLLLSLGINVTQPVYLAVYDPTNPSQGWTALAGPFNVTNETLTIPSETINPAFWMEANQPYDFAIVESGDTVATPTPTVTATPTAAPSGAPTTAPSGAPTTSPSPGATSGPTAAPGVNAQPSSLTLNAIGETAIVLASETLYGGSYTATTDSNNANDAVIHVDATSTSGVFNIKANGPGTTTITIYDNYQLHSVQVPVTVTTTEVIIK